MHEDGIRPGLDQGAIPLLALRERLHGATALRDIRQRADPAHGASLLVEMDRPVASTQRSAPSLARQMRNWAR